MELYTISQVSKNYEVSTRMLRYYEQIGLIEILDRYGIEHAEKNLRISKKNPVPYKYSILTVHTNAGYTHWVLLHGNKYYDPEFGLIEGDYTHGKITSFFGILDELPHQQDKIHTSKSNRFCAIVPIYSR